VDVLFERESELQALDRAIDGLIQGDSATLLIEGPAGIGKTRLLGEVRGRAAANGIRVLSARGSELEREFPFGVVRQLFEPVLGNGSEPALSGAAAPARSVFEGTEGDGEAAGFAILHGLFWLTLNVGAERPLVLAVDDLHWCDRPSLRFLAYLVPRLEGQPIILAATLRSAEPGTDPVLQGEIARDPLTATIRPRPLSQGGTGELAGSLLGDTAEPTFVAACQEATGGNPLLLRELLGALAAEGVSPTAVDARAVTRMDPSMVSRSVLLRLSRLPAEAVAVAQATSVLAEGPSIADIAALAGLEQDDVARATGLLVQAEILRPDNPIGFAHPLVRDAVYREQPPGERELAHARAAQLLRARGASAEAIATHLLMTPSRGDEEVVELLLEAGRSAARRGAVDSAVSYLRRALDEAPTGAGRAEILRELGLAESLVNGRAAAEHLRAAYAATEDPASRALVAHVLVRVVNFRETSAKAVELARRFRDDLPAEPVDARRALEAFELSMIFWGVLDPAEAVRLEPYLEPPSADAGVGAKMMAATAAMVNAQLDAGAAECGELALAALAGGDLLRADPEYLILALSMVLIVADREESIEVLDEVLAEAHRRGSLVGAAGTHMWRGAAHLWRGELEEAEEMLRLARREFDVWGFGTAADHWVAGFLAVVELERGDVGGARATLERAGRPRPDDSGDGARYWGNADLLVLEAEHVAPEALVGAADAFAEQHARVRNPVTSWWRPAKVGALLRLDRREEAIALAEEQLELARRWGAPGIVGGALRCLGQAVGGERGRELLEEAVATLDGTPAKLELVKALAALGIALRRERRPTDARVPLQRALDLATVCSATRLADEARAELQAIGVRPRTASVGIDALTPSERRIAGMAAEELTNREIAQALFVTPKTVEVHLSNAYRKLEIRSRRQLRGALETAMA
jgi:DNA-binding CsgD family transcriptional regulator/tetratricopeptide (TPR) repeat protein